MLEWTAVLTVPFVDKERKAGVLPAAAALPTGLMVDCLA